MHLDVLCQAPNKQLQRTVTRYRGRAAAELRRLGPTTRPTPAMRLEKRLHTVVAIAAFALPVQAFSTDMNDQQNSNLWPIHRDAELGYRISYPPNWKIAPAKGPNVRFSVVPPSPPGNCNLVVAPKPELAAMNQTELNAEVHALGLGREDWAGYVGMPLTRVRVIESRRASVTDIAAIVGVLETDLENLQGAFMRKQLVALMFSRGAVWTLNCGASDGSQVIVRSRYDALATIFSKMLGSFAFIAASASLPPAQAQSLTPAQIKQIEEIAQSVAAQHNVNSKATLDDMTVASRAVAVGRNVRIENVLRVKKGLPPSKLKEFSDETQREVVPRACAVNANNPAFGRGLTYTFAYTNTYGEKLAEFTVDQALCKNYR